jgi:hypothetical protein
MGPRDWFVVVMLAGMGIASTAFLFLERTPANFITWASVHSVMVGVYHWFVIRDQKEADKS